MSSEPAQTSTPPSPQDQYVPAFEPAPDRERRNPYYRWMMHLGLPLGLSLVLHGLILGGAAFYTFSVQARTHVEVGEYEAGIVENPDDQIGESFRWGEQVTLDAPEVAPLQDASLTDFMRVTPLDAASVQNAGSELGSGAGDGLGLGDGPLSLLGTGGGAAETGAGGFGQGLGGRGGGLGRAGVWGINIQANKIVYVIDFSGSIIVAVDDLKRELKKSVGSLRPTQSFNVILFYSEGAGAGERFKSESFEPKLQPATEETRKKFFAWLEHKSPRGETEPLQSMKRALAMGPEAIFFFSDGLFDDTVVGEVAAANKEVGAKIICFVFDEILLGDMSGLPRETDGARRLRRIAEQNRGQVKIVTGKDLRH